MRTAAGSRSLKQQVAEEVREMVQEEEAADQLKRCIRIFYANERSFAQKKL